MKRVCAGLLALMLCLALGGCTTRLEIMMSMNARMDEGYQQTMDDLMAALNAGDGEAVRALFAPNVRASVTDESANELLAFTDGKTLRAEWKKVTSGGESRSDGKVTADVYSSFDLYVDGVPYDCWMKIVYRCDTDAGEVGAHLIRLSSDYVRCDEDYPYPEGEALQVLVETGDDYVTRRVGGMPHIWTDMERRVSEDAVKTLLHEGMTRQNVIEVLGQPNAWDEYIYCTYQMESVDGAQRYVTFYGRADGPVSSVDVYDENEWLYELWKAPEVE